MSVRRIWPHGIARRHLCRSLASLLSLTPAIVIAQAGVNGIEISPELSVRTMLGPATHVADPKLGFGAAATGIGDVNGDGYSDFAVAAKGQKGAGASIYVIYGGPGALPRLPAEGDILPDFDATDGYVIELSNAVQLNPPVLLDSAIAPAGDVNGDGLSDFLIAAKTNGRNPYPHGLTFVILGKVAGGDLDLSLDLPEHRGFRVHANRSLDADERIGSPQGLGDVNGDGFDDIGFTMLRNQSHAIVFGAQNRRDTDVTTMPLNVGFWIWANPADGRGATHGLSSAGDFNGDGYADIAIRAPAPRSVGEPIDRYSAQLYILFGTDQSRNVPLSLLGGGIGVRVRNATAGSEFGLSATAVGDITLDGLADVVVTAPHQGVLPEAFVLKGRRDGGVVELNRFAQEDGWIVRSDNPRSLPASIVAPAGDVDFDGVADILFANPRQVGSPPMAMIYRAGRRPPGGGLPILPENTMYLREAAAGQSGVGKSISLAGDIDGDGRSDVILGLPNVMREGVMAGAIVTATRINGRPVAGRRTRYGRSVLDQDCRIAQATYGANGFPIGTSFTMQDHGTSWSHLWVRLCGGTGEAHPFYVIVRHDPPDRPLAGGALPLTERSWQIGGGAGEVRTAEVTLSYPRSEVARLGINPARLRVYGLLQGGDDGAPLQPLRTLYVDTSRGQIRAIVPVDLGSQELAIGYIR